jgi:hypothetical protein
VVDRRPEDRNIPITPGLGSHFYASLPSQVAHLEDATLRMVHGRMRATKDHLVETFNRFEGNVIYPFALADLRSALDLRKLFPNARLVLNDLIAPEHISNVLIAGERPNGTDALIEYLSKRFVFDRTSEWKNRDEITDLAFEVKRPDEHNPIFEVSFEINTSSYHPEHIPDFLSGFSNVTFEYRVTDFFNDESMPSGIVFLRRPGWQGLLMKDAKLWDRVNALIGDNRYLLVATDQGYRESAHLITKSFEPLLIDRYIDQIRPALPLFKIGGGVSTQVFVKSNAPHEIPAAT